MIGNNNLFCIHCGSSLKGKQQKFCSERCSKRARNKKWKKRHNKIKNERIKNNKARERARREKLVKDGNNS